MNKESSASSSKVFDLVRSALLSEGSDAPDRVCDAVVDRIWNEFKGQRIYFGRGRNRKVDKGKVWEMFTGRNHQELAKHFGVTLRRIEQIITEQSPARQWAEVERALERMTQSGIISLAQKKRSLDAAMAVGQHPKRRAKA